MVYHGKGTRTQLKVALEGGYGNLVIYGHFTSYFIAECFMHHVNLYVIRVLVELMLCDELGKCLFFFLAVRQFTGSAWHLVWVSVVTLLNILLSWSPLCMDC